MFSLCFEPLVRSAGGFFVIAICYTILSTITKYHNYQPLCYPLVCLFRG